MIKQAPSIGRILTMAVFALSCFGLLLYLWISFGGPTPMKPKGYRIEVPFQEAVQLSEQADVRISGVPVGKVVRTRREGSHTLATLELKPKYAPLPSDARAILRSKTLLGETYVALTPGTPGAKPIPEGGRLAAGQVQPTVELDEVLRAFDPSTRRALKGWMTGWAATVRGRGQDLNDVVGNLAPVAAHGADLLGTLDAERGALAGVVRDTGRAFGAVGREQGATRTLMRSGNRVLATFAARDADLERTLTILPAFLRELRPTLDAARATAVDAAPVVAALRPAAPLLRPVLRDTSALAPGLRALFARLDPVLGLARRGLPAGTRTVRAADPLMARLRRAGSDLVPVADYLGRYRRELVQMWQNTAAATQASFPVPGDSRPVHYLRALIPIWTEALTSESSRQPTNRHNPYLPAGSLDDIGGAGLPAMHCANAARSGGLPALGAAPPCRLQPLPAGTTAFTRLPPDR